MVNSRDFLFSGFALLITFLPLIITVCGLIFIIRAFRRFEVRAQERLHLEKENLASNEQQMRRIQDLNQRMISIENILKQVE
ncbi:hypothetical protein J9317_04945 [Metabacillus sp. KIGAM252]|uniref:DUF4083 domain-containing protein n=1 Tax=Metabacillus flavus TaxID=2823519 RepID=A0ABS5LBK4_9BACI|nr:hypothetical protein [Metabacillus flavus]MBS2968101.1 hypothetical protein [Metabacillus flavus]